MVIVILFILGLCLGSFVNAFVWRLHKQEELAEQKGVKKAVTKLKQKLGREDLSITTGRSMCTHCHHQLAAKDLIPVISYLSLRGKCRYCGKPIQDSPLAELLTPALFVVSYLAWPYDFEGRGLFLFVLWLVFLVAFVALTLYDLRWYLLPDKIVYPLIGLAVLQTLVVALVFGGGASTLINAFWGVLVGSGIFMALYQVSGGRWIGGGDVKLGVVLGLLAASAEMSFLIIFLSSLIGTAIALPLLAIGKANRTSHLPFGPFLMAATVIVVLFGRALLDWYMNLVRI